MAAPLKQVLLVGLTLFAYTAFAQTATPITLNNSIVKCYTDENEALLRKNNPNKETNAQFEAWMNKAIVERKKLHAGARVQAQYTIPVVFHIIHNGEAVGTNPNITAAAVMQQLNQLNKDFANHAGSKYAVAQNSEIQFVLAQFDTLGNALTEPGIRRVNRNAPPTGGAWTNYNTANAGAGWLTSYIDANVKPRTIWNPNHYLNIWVIPRITAVGVSGILLGYATFPGGTLAGLPSGESATGSGVVIYTPVVGSMIAPYGTCTGAASYGRGRTLTHEVGHYLGLRHIWGDSNCGTDYCNDTPTHQTANSGKPTHPKANSCGTADEMFENYMDYVDDDVMNTFTQDQIDRMQVVMANSTYRNTLSGSPAGGVTSTASNRIFFTNCGRAVSFNELGTEGTYPRYKDIKIRLEVENQATGNATVNFAIAGANLHGYQLSQPSVNFVAGETYKEIMLRVFDNAEDEGNRTWTISYTITGTGVSVGTNAQTFQVNILDNDKANISNNRITLINQNFESGTTGWGYLSSTGTTNLWRVGANGDAGGSGNAAYISGSAAEPFVNTYNKATPGFAVLRTPLINTIGYSNFNIRFNYRVGGENIDDVAYDYGSLMYANMEASTTFYEFSPKYASTTTAAVAAQPSISFNADAPFYFGFAWVNDNIDGNDPGFNVDDILLTALGTQIETGASTTESYDVRSNTINNFVNHANNRIIAKLEASSVAINGLKATIVSAGNGNTAITTNTGSYFRSNKVITLVPASANTNATYRATFYYTTAELAAWPDITNLKILKVNDGVSLAGVINATNAQVFTAVVDDQRTEKGYASFTADFTGGFSQFMLASANIILPVDLVTFTATPQKTAINLHWATATEINNKGFAVERSIDGTTFETIGWVDGAGNSTVTHNYTFTDAFIQPNTLYYYRLRQTDFDTRERFSGIRTARINSSAVKIMLTPNPASSDNVSLFISGIKNNVAVKMYNMQGQLVKSWNNVNAFDRQAILPLQGLNSGTYLIYIQLDDKNWTEKLVIQ